MAGLLAGKIMSRSHPVEILERQEVLPNNHSAVLRFRTDKLANELRIPFKKVTVLKGVAPWLNPIADALAYAHKCTGVYRSDRSFPTFESDLRYIAPEDFIARIADRQNIIYGSEFDTLGYGVASDIEIPLISTIPMPALMKVLEYPEIPKFEAVHGFNLVMDLPMAEAYVSLYVPNPSLAFNRISITGNRLTVEYSYPGGDEDDVEYQRQLLDPVEQARSALDMLGIFSSRLYHDYDKAQFKRQTYSKILPIDEIARRKFIHWASDRFNIYSLGRYATWRPGLLLDDLIKDIDIIGRLIDSQYETSSHRVR